MRTFEDSMGRIMVEEPAGGIGGQPHTSMATRPATDAEIMAFHTDNLARAESDLEAAREAHKTIKERHARHVALQEPVIGAPPPPGPLDPQSVVAQGVGQPGPDNTDGRLGTPLGGHTAQQGQPDQPVERGAHPATAPQANMPSQMPPPRPAVPVSTSTTPAAPSKS